MCDMSETRPRGLLIKKLNNIILNTTNEQYIKKAETKIIIFKYLYNTKIFSIIFCHKIALNNINKSLQLYFVMHHNTKLIHDTKTQTKK